MHVYPLHNLHTHQVSLTKACQMVKASIKLLSIESDTVASSKCVDAQLGALLLSIVTAMVYKPASCTLLMACAPCYTSHTS